METVISETIRHEISELHNDVEPIKNIIIEEYELSDETMSKLE